MNIPNFLNAKFVNDDGFLTPEWANILQQLFTELQLNAGTEGLKASPLSADDITKLIDIASVGPEQAAVSNSSMVFDTTKNDDRSLRIIIDGNLYQVDLTLV